jgi:hypothetical protein
MTGHLRQPGRLCASHHPQRGQQITKQGPGVQIHKHLIGQ